MSILDLAKRAGDTKPEEVSASILLYGAPGSGKTHAACAGGRPFVCLFETNGMSTIRQVNPDAVVLYIDEYQKFVDLLEVAASGELAAAGFDRLVVDSLTEAQRGIKDIIAARHQGRDEFTQQDWGTLANKSRSMMRKIRSLRIPVVATALCDEVEDSNRDGGVVRLLRPSFEGRKTPAEVSQFFNAVGYATKRPDPKDEKEFVYIVGFDLRSDRYMTKACGAVRGVAKADVVGWLREIRSPTPPAPQEEKVAETPAAK